MRLRRLRPSGTFSGRHYAAPHNRAASAADGPAANPAARAEAHNRYPHIKGVIIANPRPNHEEAKKPQRQLRIRRRINGAPPQPARGPEHIPADRHASPDIYGTYKLVGSLAVAAVVFIIILIAIFSGDAPAAVPASAKGLNSTAAVTAGGSGTEALSASGLRVGSGTDVICVDPGHGYDDPGATCEQNMGGIPEKAVTLAVALMLRDKLEEAGFTVVMTRSDDVIPAGAVVNGQYLFNPFDRVDFVNAHPEIDLFVSLHCDAYTDDASVGGTRVYYYDGGADGTVKYAEALAASLGDALSAEVQTIGKNYAEAYYVTKELSVPSVLIEMGFITNTADAKKLLSDKWRETFVSGTVQGIVDYINSQG